MLSFTSWFHYDTVEEIIDALRKDGSDFALKTANTILSHSPTGLKITLESYRRGKTMSIIECFKMETRIWHVYPVNISLKTKLNRVILDIFHY